MIISISDIKQYRAFSQLVIEDTLTKKPFAKVLSVLLLNPTSSLRASTSEDLPKLARECLKNLSAEDLKQLFFEHKEVMAEFE